ncbi:MAG: LPS-assembly protein LptD [PVC group bacterium]|nr:LPS-assembly protein LptD [PVC group bacterium]
MKSFFKTLFFFLFIVYCSHSSLFSDTAFCADNSVGDSSIVKTSSHGKPVVVDADEVEYQDVDNVIIGKGNVKINYEDMRLFCDDITVNMNSKDSVAIGNIILYYGQIKMTGEKLIYNFGNKQGYLLAYRDENNPNPIKKLEITQNDQKIYAERVDFNLETRNALVQAEVEFHQNSAKITGQNLNYDFNAEKGYFNNAKLEELPWYGKSEHAERINKDQINLKRTHFTTCEREHPHYRMQAKTVYYYPGDKIIAKNVLLFVGNAPVMYFPYWKQSLKNGKANFSISAGTRSGWGWFVFTTWRQYVNENVEARIHLDQRELKGFASGVDLNYKSQDFGEGSIKTYYTNQRDNYIKHRHDEYVSNNKLDEYINNSQEWERYRGEIKHRWQIDQSTLALFEYNKMSDINFIKEYLYREYEDDVQPVSETSLTHSTPVYNYSFYARKRTNRFYSEIERLPEVMLNVNSLEMAESGFYYRNELAATNLNRKTANSIEDTDVNRLDAYNEFKYPTKLPGKLDWINFAPYVGNRQTYYSKDRNGELEDLIRGIHYFGADMNTTFFRMSNFSANLLGIEFNRLRHVVTPSVKYTYIHTPTIPGEKLGVFDDIDSITKKNFFTFGLENHLQTKWRQSGSADMENVDLVYFYPHVDYFNRVDPGQRHFSNIQADLDLYPYRWLDMQSDLAYNQYQRRFQTANIDIWAHGGKKWSVGLGKRYERDVNEQMTSDIYYEINRLWQARVYGRYQSYIDRFQELQYTVYRDLHCWLLEMTYDMKLNEDGSTRERTFWLIFRLKAFPDETPIQLNVGYERAQRMRGSDKY